MSTLIPSLAAIEDRLFDPSPKLIQRWIDNDSSLSAEELQALEADGRACFLRELMRGVGEAAEAATSEPGASYDVDDAAPAPAHIAELHQRHVTTREHFVGASDPAPGQIRLLERATGPKGALDWDLNAPLAVLLWKATGVRDVWDGWLMAGETDYATDLDILLEPEDEPYDGLVAMVQIWNKLECYIRPEQRVIGQLAPRRLRAMVAAFTDYALSQNAAADSPGIAPCPGSLIERTTSAGDLVLCGTPLGDERDERRRYQTLYAHAAGLVKDLARLAVEAHVIEATPDSVDAAATWLRETWGRLAGGLQGLADELGGVLIPVRAVAAMSEREIEPADDVASTYQIADLIEVACVPHEVERVIKLRLTRLAAGPVRLYLILDEATLEEYTLDDHQPETTLFITPQPGLALLMTDPLGGQHRWTLAS